MIAKQGDRCPVCDGGGEKFPNWTKAGVEWIDCPGCEGSGKVQSYRIELTRG